MLDVATRRPGRGQTRQQQDGRSKDRGTLKGSPGVWLDAVCAALVAGGVEAVKVPSSVHRPKLARAGVCWRFGDREKLLLGSTDRSAAKTRCGLMRATPAPSESQAEALLNGIGCVRDPTAVHTHVEPAVRGEALRSREVMERPNAADREPNEARTACLVRIG